MCLQVWYFGPNIGHAVLGLEPSGCSYLAGESAACPAAIVKHIMSKDALLRVPVLPSTFNPLGDCELHFLWVQSYLSGAELYIMMHASAAAALQITLCLQSMTMAPLMSTPAPLTSQPGCLSYRHPYYHRYERSADLVSSMPSFTHANLVTLCAVLLSADLEGVLQVHDD